MVATKKAVLRANGTNWAIPHRRRCRHREHLAWAALVLASAAIPASGGPNLVAVGVFDLPFAEATVRESLTEQEIYYEFEGEHDFGQVVVRTSTAHSVVRKDNLVRVFYNGRGLVVNLQNLRGRDTQATVRFRLDGKLRPGRTYEYVFDMGFPGDAREQRPVETTTPAIWADGELIGVPITWTPPPYDGPHSVESPHFELYTRGKVKLPEFERQTGGAWIAIEIPQNAREGMFFRWMSFREIDEELVAGHEPEMPVPVRYIPLSSPLAGTYQLVLQRSASALWRSQNPEDYSWGNGDPNQKSITTSMVLQALTELPKNETHEDAAQERTRLTLEDSIQRARRWLANLTIKETADQPPELTQTLAVAARLHALARSPEPRDYRRTLAGDVRWLTDAQMDDGGWAERSPDEDDPDAHLLRSQNDVTEQAILALREAHFAGFTCDRRVWLNATKYCVDAQATDGGFRNKMDRYGGLGEATTVQRTASGITSMLTALDLGYGALGKNCRNYLANRSLNKGILRALSWMDRNYGEFYRSSTDVGALTLDPDAGSNPFLVGLAMQRLGAATGISRFNDKNHFIRQGEAMAEQFDQGSGFFAGDVYLTALALRTLTAGASPAVLQRITVGDDPRLEHSADAHHLMRFMMAQRKTPFSWKRSTIDTPIRDLLRVPMMLLKIAGPIEWTPEQWKKLRTYCFGGGVIIVDLDPQEPLLAEQFASGLKTVFPEYELRDLPSDDEVFISPHRVRSVSDMQVLSNGFHHFLYLPSESWSCSWHLNQTDAQADRFRFVDNVLARSTGGERLRDSLSPSTYEIGAKPDREVSVAHLETGSSTPAYPDAIAGLDRLMQANYRVKVHNASDPVSGRRPTMMWLSVTGPAPMDSDVRMRLQEHIQSGGFLFADVVSGRQDWAQQLEADLLKVDPAITLQRLRHSHPIHTGEIPGTQGFDIRKSHLRKALRTEFSDYGPCDLRALVLDDALVGVVSHHDVVSGLGYVLFPECRGPMPSDARKVAMNTLLTAMVHERERPEGWASR
ncbi:MAG: DUF4159 domain-containing protein [Planctomycetes bacterium]|nr:DUF4159 domain-containing protein [Planctomycetota bacterium]